MKLELLANSTKKLLGLELSEAQLAAFETYYNEMISWNARVNLTGITAFDEVQIKHFLDSLALLSPELRGDVSPTPFDLSNAAVIDIGAGAGFPGLPLKLIYPEMRLTLLDSVGKKTAFLTHLVGKLKLQTVTVLTGRAEDLGQQQAHRERYDLATGRAVAGLAVLAEYCLPLCKIGGIFIAPKKGEMDAELAQAQTAITTLGGKLRSTPSFELETQAHDKRLLVVADKIKPTPAIYPRRAGVPAKRPIS